MKHILLLSVIVAGLALAACHQEQPYVTTPQPRGEVVGNDQGPTPTPGYYPADGPTDEPEKKKGYWENEGEDY